MAEDRRQDPDELSSFLQGLGSISDGPKSSSDLGEVQGDELSILGEASPEIQKAFIEEMDRRGKDLQGETLLEPKYLFRLKVDPVSVTREYYYPLPDREGRYRFGTRGSLEVDAKTGLVRSLFQDSALNPRGGEIMFRPVASVGFKIAVPKNILLINGTYSLDGQTAEGLSIWVPHKTLPIPGQSLYFSLRFMRENELKEEAEGPFRAVVEKFEDKFCADVYYDGKFLGKYISPSTLNIDILRDSIYRGVSENIKDMSHKSFEHDLKWRRDLDLIGLTKVNWEPATPDSSERL